MNKYIFVNIQKFYYVDLGMLIAMHAKKKKIYITDINGTKCTCWKLRVIYLLMVDISKRKGINIQRHNPVHTGIC